ncbi:MAG: stage III sporulation protein AB [Sporomusaceae bacterium]|nr:stage III sporulation protein AB [Sporomusaceae bacterium]
MWLKLVGSILLIAAGGLLGFTLAARCQSRPQQIRQLINGIAALRAHIRYASMPLAEAFIASSTGLSGAIAGLFAAVGSSLSRESGLTPQAAIARELACGGQLTLNKPEQEAIILFGANLGKMNREEQERHCDMLLEQLEAIEQDALGIRDRNAAMYRYLGVCGGMTVAILLI